MKNFELSNGMAKAIKSESKTFIGVRRNILAAVNDKVVKGNNITKVLSDSKKDAPLYQKLLSLTAYTFAGEETENGLSIVKRYSEKTVLNAAELSIIEDCTPAFVIATEKENLANAIERCKSDFENSLEAVLFAQNIAASNNSTDADIVAKLAAKVESAKKNSLRKEAIYKAVQSL